MLIVMLAAMALFADAASAAAVPAQTPAEAAATAKQVKAAESDVVCHKEVPTGSTIPVKVCRSRAAEAANRTEARKQLEQLQLSTPRPPGG